MVEIITLTPELLRKTLMAAASDHIYMSVTILMLDFEMSRSQLNSYCGQLFKALDIPGIGKDSLAALKRVYEADSKRVLDIIDVLCAKVGEVGLGTRDPIFDRKAQLKFYQPLAINSLAETAHPMVIANLNDVPFDGNNPHFIPPNASEKMLIVIYEGNDEHLCFDGPFFLALLESDVVKIF
jgi:hypothetical protein